MTSGEVLVFGLQGQNHNEFGKEAKRFANYCATRKENLFLWDPPKNRKERREMFARMITEIGSHDREWVHTIAIFCHGFPEHLQIGLTVDNVDEFAEACSERCVIDVRVVLYSCSAADNDVREIYGDGPAMDGGLCDELRDALVRQGFAPHVFGHKTSGHTTKNPFLAEFTIEDEGIGGHWVCEPNSKHWQEWKKYLRGNGRFFFPFKRWAEHE